VGRILDKGRWKTVVNTAVTLRVHDCQFLKNVTVYCGWLIVSFNRRKVEGRQIANQRLVITEIQMHEPFHEYLSQFPCNLATWRNMWNTMTDVYTKIVISK
jgi:hypothetical protein